MPELYFENERTQRRYKVIRFDKEKGEVVLRGEHAEFTEKYDKTRFQKMGYILKQG